MILIGGRWSSSLPPFSSFPSLCLRNLQTFARCEEKSFEHKLSGVLRLSALSHTCALFSLSRSFLFYHFLTAFSVIPSEVYGCDGLIYKMVPSPEEGSPLQEKSPLAETPPQKRLDSLRRNQPSEFLSESFWSTLSLLFPCESRGRTFLVKETCVSGHERVQVLGRDQLYEVGSERTV